MDVWNKLPIHLLERIVAFLPIQGQAQFRVVNKSFNAWIESKEFDDLCQAVPSKKSLGFWGSWDEKEGKEDLFDHMGGILLIHNRPPCNNFDNNSLKPFITDPCMWRLKILVATNCFVCMYCMPRENEHFAEKTKPILLLLNLINKTAEEILPLNRPMFKPFIVSLAYKIVLNDNGNDFCFVRLGETIINRSRKRVIDIYDSSSKHWISFEKLPRLRRGFDFAITFDRIFFIHRTKKHVLEFISCILDRSNNIVKKESGIKLPNYITTNSSNLEYQLIAIKNRIFMTTILSDLTLSTKTLILWEMDLSKMICVKITQLEFLTNDTDIVAQGTCDNCIIFELTLIRQYCFKIYDLKKKKWQDLVPIPWKMSSSSHFNDFDVEYYCDPSID